MPRFVSPSIVAALETWAAQKRATFIEEQLLSSVLARIKTERTAAGEPGAVRGQRWAEVYTGDGLRVHLVLPTLRELPRLTLTYYYVLRWPWRVPVPEQVRYLGITKRDYWRFLEAAETAVDTGLQVMEFAKNSAHSITADAH